MRSKWHLLLLFVMLVAGVALRLWRIDAVQPYNSDEAMYLRQARFMHVLARRMLHMTVPVADAEGEGIWRHVRKSDWYDKPCWLHSGFIAVFMFFTGVSAVSGALANGFFSMAAAWLLYPIARRMCGKTGACLAAGLLAVSFYWLIYSRGHWAEVDGVFFVLLSFYSLLRTLAMEKRRAGLAILTGAIAGVGVLCHYRLVPVFVPLCLSAFLLSDVRRGLREAFLVLLGFGGLLIAVAIGLRILVVFVNPGFPFSGLIGAILQEYLPGEGGLPVETGFQPQNILAFLYYFVRNNGWCAAILCIAGVMSIFRRPTARRTKLAVFGFVLVPLGVFCFQIWVLARPASLLIPFLCILAGCGLNEVVERGQQLRKQWRTVVSVLAGLLVCGALAENVAAGIRFAGNDVGYGEVAQFLERKRASTVFADPGAACIYAWHAPDLSCESLHTLRARLDAEDLCGAYVVFDAQKFHMYPGSIARVDELERLVATRAELVFQVGNLTTAWREFVLDGTQAHNLSDMLASMRGVDENDITTIRVYRLVGERGED